LEEAEGAGSSTRTRGSSEINLQSAEHAKEMSPDPTDTSLPAQEHGDHLIRLPTCEALVRGVGKQLVSQRVRVPTECRA